MTLGILRTGDHGSVDHDVHLGITTETVLLKRMDRRLLFSNHAWVTIRWLHAHVSPLSWFCTF